MKHREKSKRGKKKPYKMRRLGFRLAFEDDYRVYYNCSSLSQIVAKYVSPLSHGVCRPAQKGEYQRGD